MDNLLLNQHTS